MARKKQKRTIRRWTVEEDKRLIDLVSEHPGNLQEAFRLFAEETRRSPKAVAFRWYFSLRKKENTKTCLLTIGKRKASRNSKNFSDSAATKIKVSIWNTITKLLFGKQ